MAKTESTISSKFHAFLKQRDSKTNASMQEAQRLVNLYRVLSVFGADFVDQYNTMLLNATDDVQMALNALIGGQEVRQYLEFLHQEQNENNEDDSSDKTGTQMGWLPPPEEEELPTGNKGTTNSDLASFMKAEEEKFAKMIAALREEQETAMKHLSDQLSTTLQAQTTKKAPSEGTSLAYSEIIEEGHKEK